ncbi:MAG TPA: hypothetical protein VKA01_10560, partial [Vicinamibacteria bacterium]|nr:hypothetical protein [Vicinamibacteria bacterium]
PPGFKAKRTESRGHAALVKASEKLASSLVKASEKPASELVNASGNQQVAEPLVAWESKA